MFVHIRNRQDEALHICVNLPVFTGLSAPDSDLFTPNVSKEVQKAVTQTTRGSIIAIKTIKCARLLCS